MSILSNIHESTEDDTIPYVDRLDDIPGMFKCYNKEDAEIFMHVFRGLEMEYLGFYDPLGCYCYRTNPDLLVYAIFETDKRTPISKKVTQRDPVTDVGSDEFIEFKKTVNAVLGNVFIMHGKCVPSEEINKYRISEVKK